MVEQSLNVIYFLAEHPEKIAESIIKKLAACLLDKADVDTGTEQSQDKENGRKCLKGH